MLPVTDEADRARCETCDQDYLRTNGIECEGCGGFICWVCWKGVQHGKNPHFCGELTDRAGHLVKPGTVLSYPDRQHVQYRVSSTPETFKKNMVCYGVETRGSKPAVVLRPRLMEVAHD